MIVSSNSHTSNRHTSLIGRMISGIGRYIVKQQHAEKRSFSEDSAIVVVVSVRWSVWRSDGLSWERQVLFYKNRLSPEDAVERMVWFVEDRLIRFIAGRGGSEIHCDTVARNIMNVVYNVIVFKLELLQGLVHWSCTRKTSVNDTSFGTVRAASRYARTDRGVRSLPD